MGKVKLSDYKSLKASGSNILLELFEVSNEEAVTSTGLIIPEKTVGKKFENPKEIGVVVDLGPDYKGDLQINDHVVIGTFVGAPIGIEGKKYLSLDNSKVFIKLYM